MDLKLPSEGSNSAARIGINEVRVRELTNAIPADMSLFSIRTIAEIVAIMTQMKSTYMLRLKVFES